MDDGRRADDRSPGETFEVPTPFGPARVLLRRPPLSSTGPSLSSPGRPQSPTGLPRSPTGLLVLGPGASGQIAAVDLHLALDVALAHGMVAALVEPAYRVAGRTVPPRGLQADDAWLVVVQQLVTLVPGVALVTGGRSFGSRVACRTAAVTGSAAVLCLAFPEHPPGAPQKSRQAELSAVTVPTLVIQGERDPFGMPLGSDTCRVVVVPGDHSLKKDLAAVRAAIEDWLPQVVPGR